MLGNPNRSSSTEADVTKLGNRRFLCIVCGHIYDEILGDPDSGIPPGTIWEEIPDSWRCPVCRVGKQDFELFPYPREEG